MLTATGLARLGAGFVDDSDLSILVEGQAGRRRMLVAAAANIGGQSSRAALALLDAVEGVAPDAVAAALAHPPVSRWALGTIKGHHSDRWYLCGVAAAAAVRAGHDFSMTVQPVEGRIELPGLGQMTGLSGAVTVTLNRMEQSMEDRSRWRPAHRFRCESQGQVWNVALDDTDPYRAAFPWPTHDRLSPVEVASLGELCAQAWSWLVARFPQQAAALATCVRTLVIVEKPKDSAAVSAASRTVWGSIALSIPDDPGTLALLLLHELNHLLLDATMDLVALCTPDGVAVHRAPWRVDPRPARQLLHGLFAHLNVTRFHREESLDTGRRPGFAYAYSREMTERGLVTLLASDELTESGRTFATAMAEQVARWAADDIDTDAWHIATEIADADAIRWALENHTVPQPTLDGLVGDWTGGRPPGPIVMARVQAQRAQAVKPTGLTAAIKAIHLAGPPAGDTTWSYEDHAYARGRVNEAIAGYRSRLRRSTEDHDAWVGLAMSLRRAGDDHAYAALAQRPDLVKAVCAATVTPPEEVARWLGAGLLDQVGGGSM